MRETKKGQNIQRISIKETQSEITFMRYDIALPQDKHDKLDCETASTVSFDKPHLLFNKQAPPIEPIINKRGVVTCCLLAK